MTGVAIERGIVWNRLAFEDQIVALVIRDAVTAGAYEDRPRPGFIDLAWDDGRPFLIGIRTLRADLEQTSLEAWRSVAAVKGNEVRDERRDPDILAEADANNARAAVAARLEQERRRREARRDCQPMDAGGLFDEVRRNTLDLFNPEIPHG